METNWQDIVWTRTHVGRGHPIDADLARQSLKNISSAFEKAKDKGGVQVVIDEDVAFLPSDTPKDELGVGVAKTEEEAVRLWWNNFGWVSWDSQEAAEVIYCGGQGPHGLGGFTEPEVDAGPPPFQV